MVQVGGIRPVLYIPVNHSVKAVSDKEKILQRIRAALAQEDKEAVRPPDFVADVYAPAEEQDLAVLFAKSLLDVQGFFCFCENEQEFLQNLFALLRSKRTKEIFVWEKYLQQVLDLAEVAYQADDSRLHEAEMSITTCEALIARTGSILVSSKRASGRRLNIYPPVHVVVAFTSQLCYDLRSALQSIQQSSPTMPSMLSLITGPSRTADIEKTLVLGAHGPKELHVFLIEDLIE